MKKIKVSIIIATYNSGKTLRQALNSIRQLNFEEWQCLVIDGLSKDDTIQIIDSYKSADPRFDYISESDKGIYDALNKGINLAKGEWIFVLGSDDELTPDGISYLLAAGNDYDVVYGNVYLKSLDGKISHYIAKNHSHLKYVMSFSHQSVIMRRSVIKELDGFNLDYKIRADFDLMQRAFLSNYKFKYVNKFIAYFTLAGLSSTADKKTHIERYHICKKNKSTKFPFFWYCFQESKFLLRYYILDRINRIK